MKFLVDVIWKKTLYGIVCKMRCSLAMTGSGAFVPSCEARELVTSLSPSNFYVTMPKAPSSAAGPLSILFAINKPTGARALAQGQRREIAECCLVARATGMVSMQLLNKIQPLLASSTLFKAVEEGTTGKQGKGKGKRRRGENRVKLGQGGTLDPLADGVLGELLPHYIVYWSLSRETDLSVQKSWG